MIASINRQKVRAVRLSDTMWKKIQSMAAVVEMRPSEFIRRVLEDRIADISKSALSAPVDIATLARGDGK
jgi:predicted DNA-binding ribbon-helix-helix protein